MSAQTVDLGCGQKCEACQLVHSAASPPKQNPEHHQRSRLVLKNQGPEDSVFNLQFLSFNTFQFDFLYNHMNILNYKI